MTSSHVLAKLLLPVRHLYLRKHQQHQLLLHYLHAQLIQIVPSVHLPLNQAHELRIAIEISDARELIWSYYRHPAPVTAKEEAVLLHTLLHQRTIIEEPGPQHPPIVAGDIDTHNLRVAKYLKHWEQANPS